MVDFLRTIWPLIKPYKGRLILGTVMGLLAGLVEPLPMLVLKLVVNAICNIPSMLKLPSWTPDWVQNWITNLNGGLGGAAEHHWAFLMLAASIPAVMIVRGIFGYLNIYCLQWASCRAIIDLRTKLFIHLTNLPLSFFETTSTGELMSRLMNDVIMLHSLISGMTSVIVKDPVTLIALLGFLLWQNPQMTLASLIVMPICIVPITIYSRKVRKTAATIQTEFAELSQITHETFTGLRVIKAYNLEKVVERQFLDKSVRYVGQYMRLVRSMEIPGPLIEFFGALGMAVLVVYLGLLSKVKVTPGDLLQTLGCIYLMYRPIKSLTKLQSQYVQARGSTARAFELLATKSTLLEPAQPKPLKAAGEDIRFDHIDFSYGERKILRDIDLTVKAGQLVALVGATGSGKTTLTNLLLRFYDPVAGAVRIGGLDIREVATQDLRNQIAVVAQETILFNETIRRNIELGRPGATDAEIEAAARHADAHEFIMQKERGYDTVIGEKGVTLSGGQRQRVAIARAILKNAPILILDEATNALDAKTEQAVQAALEGLMQGRTTVCIAHRLSTIQNADLIVVLDQGRIMERGRHAELMALEGIYRRLHDLSYRTETEPTPQT